MEWLPISGAAVALAACCGLFAVPLLLFRKLIRRREEGEEDAAGEGSFGKPLSAGRRKEGSQESVEP